MSSKLERNVKAIRTDIAFHRRLTSWLVGGICNVLLARLMAGIDNGSICFILPDERELEFQSASDGPNAVLHFNSYAGILRLCFGGYMGLGEGYVNNHWATPSLKTLFQFGIRNQEPLKIKLSGSRLAKIIRKILRFIQRNTKTGSKRNIAYHYDLGNEFYELWLDPSMTYSSAIFENSEESLEKAQIAKYRRIVKELDIQPDHRILEIGCGWGGFAEFVAKETGASVTAITISQEQHDYAVDRIEKSDLSDKVEIKMLDYREVSARYDRIVSIEMLEAVGEEYWPDYFRIIAQSLAEGGTAMVQVILVPDARFENYRQKSDFIQRHIFPGGMLLSPSEMEKQAGSADLVIDECYKFGSSYGKTLDRWSDHFSENWTDIQGLGFDDRFKRLWEYYLNYTAAGFHAGTIDVGQFLVKKKL